MGGCDLAAKVKQVAKFCEARGCQALTEVSSETRTRAQEEDLALRSVLYKYMTKTRT